MRSVWITVLNGFVSSQQQSGYGFGHLNILLLGATKDEGGATSYIEPHFTSNVPTVPNTSNVILIGGNCYPGYVSLINTNQLGWNQASALTVALSDNVAPAGTFYSTSDCSGAPITSLQFQTTESMHSFYYRPSPIIASENSSGNIVVASQSPFTGMSVTAQAFDVVPPTIGSYALEMMALPPSGVVPWIPQGVCLPMTLGALAANGAPLVTANGFVTVANSVSGSPVQFSNDPACGTLVNSLAVNMMSNNLNQPSFIGSSMSSYFYMKATGVTQPSGEVAVVNPGAIATNNVYFLPTTFNVTTTVSTWTPGSTCGLVTVTDEYNSTPINLPAQLSLAYSVTQTTNPGTPDSILFASSGCTGSSTNLAISNSASSTSFYVKPGSNGPYTITVSDQSGLVHGQITIP